MKLLRWIPLGLLAVAASGANAATFSVDLNKYLTGTEGYNWTPFTVATLTFTDIGPDTVSVSIQHYANSLAGDQFISAIWFGINPLVDPLVQANQTPANIFNGGINIAPNGHNGIGANYNFQLELEQLFKNGAQNRFEEGTTASFTLSGLGVDAMDFATTANGGSGLINAAIHLQGLPTGASIKVGGYNEEFPPTEVVPEPASMAMAGFAAFAAIAGRRRAKAAKK